MKTFREASEPGNRGVCERRKRIKQWGVLRILA